jgi:hypothetical protein
MSSSDEEGMTLADVAKQKNANLKKDKKKDNEDDDDDDDDEPITLAEIAKRRSKETDIKTSFGLLPSRKEAHVKMTPKESKQSPSLAVFVGTERDVIKSSSKKRHLRDEIVHDVTEYADDGDSFIVDDEEEEEDDEEDDEEDTVDNDNDESRDGFSHAVFDRLRDIKAEREGNESGLGIALSLEKLGISSGASMKDRTVFESYCKFLVAALIAPGLVEETFEMRKCPDSQLWQFCRKQIEERLQGHIDSLASSQAWNGSKSRPYLNEAIRHFPFIESSEVVKDDDCEACGRKGHAIAYELTFFGPLVDTKRLYSNNPQWIEAIPRGEHRSHRFSILCGRQCHMRLQTFSLLSHFKYKILLALSRTVRRYWLGPFEKKATSILTKKSNITSLTGLSSLSKTLLDASSVENDDSLSDGSEDDNLRMSRLIDEEGLKFQEFTRESSTHHKHRICEEVTHFIDYSTGIEVDSGEAEGWESKVLETVISERRRWTDVRLGLLDSSNKKRRINVKAVVEESTEEDEERTLPIRASTWSSDPTRRLFIRSQSKLLTFVLLDDVHIQHDLLEGVNKEEKEEEEEDVSTSRKKMISQKDLKRKSKKVKEPRHATLPLTQDQTTAFSRLSRLYSDEILRPLASDSFSLFKSINTDMSMSMPQSADITSETNLLARLPVALDWDDASFESFFSSELWSRVIDEQHSRFHSILSQAKMYATEDKVNDSRPNTLLIDPELDGAGGSSTMKLWRNSNSSGVTNFGYDTNSTMLNFAFNDDNEDEDGNDDEEEDEVMEIKMDDIVKSKSKNVSKPIQAKSSNKGNDDDDDDDDEPVRLADIVNQKKK